MADSIHRPWVDRSRRLRAFGFVTIAFGVLFAGLGLLHPLLPLLSRALDQAGDLDAKAVWIGFGLYLGFGAALIAAGVASYRRRRWARPVITSLGRMWLLGGILLLLMVLQLGDAMVQQAVPPGTPVDPVLLSSMKWIMIGGSLIAGIFMPSVLLLAYSGQSVRATFLHYDPVQGRDVPDNVLGFAFVLVIAALLMLPFAFYQALPVFSVVFTGGYAILLSILGFAAILALALGFVRLQQAAWWGTVGLLVLMGASAWRTLDHYTVRELLEIYRYDPKMLEMIGDPASAPLQIATLVITGVGIIELVTLRRHFARPAEK